LIEYTQTRKVPEYYAKYRIAEFLLEDIPEGDITSEGIIDISIESTAIIQAQEDLVFAGETLFYYFFDETFKCALYFKDGQQVKAGDIIALISGPAAFILARERVLLNLLQRLCSIATITHKYVEIASKYDVKILDTRKTTPGLRLFEKYAVVVGGGYNHRSDLSSGILIKDNHIKIAGGLKNAVDKARNANGAFKIEVECDTIEQVSEAVKLDIDGILLDNMSPDTIKKAIKIIKNSDNNNIIHVEASGGINLDNLEQYAKTGIEVISVGCLTHSVKAADIHLEII
jgi:nicotinate-nucleotide pyrophosphorylase (carboxylating)